MTRILVAGVGNVFFGDDGFGVEVARRLLAAPPDDTRVADFGIRGVHLAYELLAPFDLVIVADCMPRGGAPGTLYVVEPELEACASPADAPGDGEAGASVAMPVRSGVSAGPHGMDLPLVFAAVRELGGSLPRTLVLGCEPHDLEPGIGLSPSVERAIPGALDLIRELIARKEPSCPSPASPS